MSINLRQGSYRRNLPEKKELSTEILSDIIVFMKYAKYIPELKRRETWEEMVTRNKEMHIKKNPIIKKELEWAYQFVYEKKVFPSMRSFQFAGKPIELNNARLFNCAYLPIDDYRAFSETMFLLLGGSGVGYSIQKHHIDQLPEIRKPTKKRKFLIGDSIEGWADAIKYLMRSYFEGRSEPDFDYRDIRQKGAKLITAGGKAPGPQPLKDCIHNIKKILDAKENGSKLTPFECHEIQCFIADAVLSGGIRRSAMICFFGIDDIETLTCKTGEWYITKPHLARANNSVVLLRHKITREDFSKLWKTVELSRAGEPGIYFTNDKNMLANPCVEASLNPNTFCNLVDIVMSSIVSQADFNDRAKAAAIIGTSQASFTDFHYLREKWQKNTEKDALLGVGLTGIADEFVMGLDFTEAANKVLSTNEAIATTLGINLATRSTMVKPAGTSSLVGKCSSGVHAWYDEYYIRRITVGKNEAIYRYLYNNHPQLLEDDVFKPHNTAKICIPVKAPEGAMIRTESPITTLDRVKKIHSDWIKPAHRKGDNTHNVSCTINIKDNEWSEVEEWMWTNRDAYNGISVIPYDNGTYTQAPHETITEEKYYELVSHLKKVDLTDVLEEEDDTDHSGEVACAGGACELK